MQGFKLIAQDRFFMDESVVFRSFLAGTPLSAQCKEAAEGNGRA